LSRRRLVRWRPHSLACAARLPSAVSAVTIAAVAPFDADGLDWMAGMGEANVEEFGAAIEGEQRLRPLLTDLREQLKEVTVEEIISTLDSLLPEVDRAVLVDEYGDEMAARFREALRVGVDGWVDDDLAFVKPWGFELDEIQIPVAIWQGSADLMVPFSHGEWLAGRMPDATAHLETGEGHLSVGLGALDRIVDELVSKAGV
jgi:pimeloyl-ACP methyl ester carboxylesterase